MAEQPPQPQAQPHEQPQPAPSPLALAIVDVDGVVADVRHRLHHVERSPKDWHAFFAGAERDEPLVEGLRVVAGLADDGVRIHWLTGRPAWLREVTQTWLDRHGLPQGPLTMRPLTDRRPARLFKRGRVDALARTWAIQVVIDDDVAVVTELRGAGYSVLHADWMGREITASGTDLLDLIQEEEGRT